MKVRRRSIRRPRRRRPPSAATRRRQSPKLPRAVELYLTLALGAHTRAFAKAVRGVLTEKKIATFAAPEPEEKHDAKDDDGVKSTMADVRKRVRGAFDSSALTKQATTAAGRVVAHSKDEFARLGIKVTDEPALAGVVDTWRDEFLGRLEGIEDDQLSKLEQILADGFGHRAETLSSEIARQLDDVTPARADFLARDATLKLNARITKKRHEAAGVEQYVWTTSNDERVRPMHEELEGQTFSWDDPPVTNEDGDTNHPGEDYQCRCIPFPILPELDDDEGEDDDEDGGDEAPSESETDDGSAADGEDTEG